MFRPTRPNVHSKSKTAAGNYAAACKDERDWYLARIEPETSRHMTNETSQAHMVITLLAGANAGGAVAVLAYIAQLTSSSMQMIPNARGVLAGYAAGFIAALFLAILTYYASLRRLTRWTNRVSSFYSGGCLWRDLWNNMTPWYGRWPLHVLGWASFLCFVDASWVGIAQMLEANKAMVSVSAPTKKAPMHREAGKQEPPRPQQPLTGSSGPGSTSARQ